MELTDGTVIDTDSTCNAYLKGNGNGEANDRGNSSVEAYGNQNGGVEAYRNGNGEANDIGIRNPLSGDGIVEPYVNGNGIINANDISIRHPLRGNGIVLPVYYLAYITFNITPELVLLQNYYITLLAIGQYL